jgi:hypothetical protein
MKPTRKKKTSSADWSLSAKATKYRIPDLVEILHLASLISKLTSTN